MSGKNKKVSQIIKNDVNAVETVANNTVTETKETGKVVFDEPIKNPEYSNREWLEKNSPAFSQDVVSKKYDSDREPAVQDGLKTIQELGIKVNPLILLLAKWWEVKPARAEIKKMIDAESQSLQVPEDVYMQVNLKAEIEKLAGIQTSIDRLRYSITYYKPRTNLNQKDIFQPMTIAGKLYKVNLRILAEVRDELGIENKDAIRARMAEISEPMNVAELADL